MLVAASCTQASIPRLSTMFSYYQWTYNTYINMPFMPEPSDNGPNAHADRHRREASPRTPRRHRGSHERDAPVIPEMHQSADLPSSSRSQRPREPIRFYDSDQPYYDFTNFAPVSVVYCGQRYPTAEHLFQAYKFFDVHPEIAERIRKLPTPRAALEEASRLQRLQRQDWFDVNVAVMDIILEAKFSQHKRLRCLLLDTGDRELVEASPVDSFWGVGPNDRGRNELGKALMRVRDKMRTEDRKR